MRAGMTISIVGHVAVLAWSAWTFVVKPNIAPLTQSLPVDIVTSAEFSQITAGAKAAPKAEKAKPLAEKVAPKRPVEDAAAKIDKKEITAATDVPPAPESKKREPVKKEAAPKPEPVPKKEEAKKPEPKKPDPTPKTQEAKKPEPKKPDLIAEALKKDEAKKPESKKSEPKKPDTIAETLKKDEAKKPEPKKAEAKPTPKAAAQEASRFDPRSVQALLDKRTPQRLAAAGDTLNHTPTLGLPTGTAAQLSQSELDALRARLAQLWNPPAGAKNPEELVVLVRMRLNPDGSLAAQPTVLNSGSSPLFVAARDSAVRAINRGQPFTMLRPEHYDLWKDVEITFDPREMFRG
jgi:TolA protein